MRKNKYQFEKALILNVGQSFLSKKYTNEDIIQQPNLDKNIREGAVNYGNYHGIKLSATIFKRTKEYVVYKITRKK